jgi:shikimate dehydrogenase
VSEQPTRLVLVGHPVSHSASPKFQNAALEAADLPQRYEAIDVTPADLAAVLRSLRDERVAGNVTVPHKESAFAACDETTAQARRVRAVNAFAVRDGRLVGHNTDIEGVKVAVEALLGSSPQGKLVGVIGAGGAAAAVLAAVEAWAGCRAVIANRSRKRADELAARFSSIARSTDTATLGREADIVINATALGLRPADELPVDLLALRAGVPVLDLVYGPDETRLVREARAAGHPAADGMSMLVAQGAAAFAWWFGRQPDLEVMWRALGRRPRE